VVVQRHEHRPARIVAIRRRAAKQEALKHYHVKSEIGSAFLFFFFFFFFNLSYTRTQ